MRPGIDRARESQFMSDLARLRIWDDPAIRGALSWYLDVAENRRPAKFRIAATVATGLDPLVSCEDALWAELDRLTPIFLMRWQTIRAGAPLPQAADGPSLLELKAGRHARSAVGNVMLPNQISVEIEGIVAVKA
jgi:hypothetical protein